MYNFALIGYGRIGMRHAEHIITQGKLLAICDIDENKVREAAIKYHARSYTSLDNLLEKEVDVQIIVICTPNGFHAEHAIKSLQNGRHVLCEKPLCISTSAAYSIMDTSHFFRRKIFVVKQNRYNEPVVFVKKLLDEKRLGNVLSFGINCLWSRPQEYYCGDWRGTKDLDGGLLYTQFSHFIDLLYWFLGDVSEVSGFTSNSGLRQQFHLEDKGAIALKMNSGAIGTLHYTINSFNQNAEGSFTIIGDKGSVKIGGQYLNKLEWLHINDAIEYKGEANIPANNYGFYTGSMSNHDKVYQDLIPAIENKETSLPHILESVKTIEIIEKIYHQSLQV